MNIIMKKNFLLILANLLVPNDFDESIFETCVIPPPENPVHQFA